MAGAIAAGLAYPALAREQEPELFVKSARATST
jgi:hypothetical protein